MSDWKKNTGQVPEEVNWNTRLEVTYRDGDTQVWEVIFAEGSPFANDSEALWSFDDEGSDVILYRVLDG